MNGSATKLRVGLLVDSYVMNAWEHRMIEAIQRSEFAQIVVVVVNNAAPAAKSIRARLQNFADHGFYSIYDRLERRVFHPEPDAFQPADATGLLRDAGRLDVVPKMKRFSDTLSDDDVARVEAYDLDVLVRLGFRILRGKILQAARCGVWSYHHGDNRVNRGGPAGFWEVMLGHRVTGSMLQILSEDLDGGLCLYRSYSATEPVSVRRNRNSYYWKTLAFVPRMLRELHALGKDEFLTRVRRGNEALGFYCHRLYVTPGNAEFSLLAARHLWRRIRARAYKAFFRHQWLLLFDHRKRFPTSLWRFKKIQPPRDRFWADPCVVAKDGRYYVFLEEFLYETDRGHIAVMELDAHGVVTQPRRVLAGPHHMSYPFVFEWENTYYMVPETYEAKKIDVFRCDRFPDEWHHQATLMQNVAAADATLFQRGGRWWMFVNIAENEGASPWDELFLFHADQPLSRDWTPHPRNPIVSDVRRARPAGRVFEHDGRLFRPSQDSSRTYGYGIRMNEILVLTPDDYEEREISSIEPLWERNLKGIHTLSRDDGLTVADAKQRRFKFWG